MSLHVQAVWTVSMFPFVWVFCVQNVCVCGWPMGELLLNGSHSERSSFTEEWHASLALLLTLFFSFPTLHSLTRLHSLTVRTSSRVASHVCHSLTCFLPLVSMFLHTIFLFISYMSSLSFSNSLTITLSVHFKGGLLAWNKIRKPHIGETQDIKVNYTL